MVKHNAPPVEVNNITSLRDHAIQTLDKLVSGNIDVQDAVAASKLYSNVVDMLKLEIDYNKALGRQKDVLFLDGAPSMRTLTPDDIMALEGKSSPKDI